MRVVNGKEKEVYEIQEVIWQNPAESEQILKKTAWKNEEISKFEEVLKLEPDDKNILDYCREHKGEIEVKKCSEELKLPLKYVKETVARLTKKAAEINSDIVRDMCSHYKISQNAITIQRALIKA